MILSDGKIKKNIPNEKIKCLKFLKKVKICCVYVKMSVSKSVNVSAFLVWQALSRLKVALVLFLPPSPVTNPPVLQPKH